MTKVLGLTGGIATGKSTADEFFKKQNIPIIDSDKIAHDILNIGKPAYKEVKSIFGSEYLNADQTINRKKLGHLVFSDPKELKKLNDITHPLIYQEIQEKIQVEKSKNTPLVIVDAPVLFESNGQNYCDATLVITLPLDVQLKRLMARNNLTKAEAMNRINSQMPLIQKEKLATYVVDNTGTIKELENKLEKVLIKMCEV
ncbi:dephospho-CoA kinase [Lactobacillus sp. LL6]|uniref:dephospho-CoA kinase n=1 Tax=Lactobacillus sp. LL6 TaxID=2596827 RepID=UPI001186BD16|nr:dephospho-CoA kinase [Lactobacillus sp. LL6]TSO26600.1 dephospho-CoA kinase [Lactobacillus sp. LL6]